MNQSEFQMFTESFLNATAKLLVSKGAEYAGSEDRLANFKRGAGLTGCTAEQVCFIYLSKHYDALATFIREGKKPGAEPIMGRLHDLANYVLLLAALIRERQDAVGEAMLKAPR